MTTTLKSMFVSRLPGAHTSLRFCVHLTVASLALLSLAAAQLPEDARREVTAAQFSHETPLSMEQPETGGAAVIDDYVRLALAQNTALRAAWARYEAATFQVPQAAALPDMNIGAGYFVLPVETRLGPQRAALSLSQSFPWFGMLSAEERSAEARARSMHEEYVDMRNRITYEVRSSGYDMYVLERSIHSVREQFLWLQHIRTLALVRYEAGDTGYSDLLRLEMEAEEITNRIRTLEDGRSALRARMLRLTGLTSPDDIIFPDALPTLYRMPDDNILYSRMTAGNPRLRRLIAEAEFWKYRSDAARRMGYPRFTIGAVYTIIDPRTDMVVQDNGRDALLAQVGISIPLFGSRYSSLEKQNIQQEFATRQSYEDETKVLRQRLEETLRDYREAQRRVVLMLKLLSLAEHARETVLQEYTAGKTSLDQLIGIERNIIRYVLDREQAEADLRKHQDFIQYLISEEY